MNRFLKMLKDKGITEKIQNAVKKDRELCLTDILEYELTQDEDLEDEFLNVAHSLALNAIIFEILGDGLDIPDMTKGHMSCTVKELEFDSEEDLKDFIHKMMKGDK